MPKLLEVLLHPYKTPKIGKYLDPFDIDEKRVRPSLDPDTRLMKDKSRSSYVDPFTGKTVVYRKGGKVRIKKYAKGGPVPEDAQNDKLAPDFLNEKAKPKRPAPKPAATPKPKKFARGGGIEIRGKTRGKFI